MGESRGRLHGFVRARTGKQKVGALGAVALLLTAPFGGWDPVAAPAPHHLELGRHFAIGPYDVSLEKVVWARDLKPTVEADPGKRLLVVVATIENTSDQPQYENLLTDSLWTQESGVDPDEQGKATRPDLFVIADGTDLSEVNPHVRYRVALVFQQESDYAADTITLDVGNTHFRTADEDVLTLDPDVWVTEPGVARRGSLPVKGQV